MNTYILAVLALVFGNLLASLSDVAVKLLDGAIPSFQYVFIRQLVAFLVLTPIYLRFSGKKTLSEHLSNAKINFIRGQLILIGAACMVVAITHLPLATANAVFYAAPLLMLPLSVWILKETPKKEKIIATVIGFIGVLIVLRPSQFHWAALFALGTAITLAVFHILVKKIPTKTSVIHTLFWTSVFSLPVSAFLAATVWQNIHSEELIWIVFSSIAILGYNGLAVYAYKKSEANQVALVEYSGLIFVTLFGVIWFDEVPNWLTAIGIGMIVVPIIYKQQTPKLKTVKQK
ncbi:DMT family transporter [Vibrio sp. HN007]|uniref:DMT family transporter n=1 Tax=Vibrio iocasae TaxID=3098914 RepID=UPI0035D41211